MQVFEVKFEMKRKRHNFKRKKGKDEFNNVT